MMRTFCLSTVCLLSMLFVGCAGRPANSDNITASGSIGSEGEIAAESNVNGYTIKALDPLFIRFSGVSEQQTLEVVVDENGEVSLLHLAAPIKAAGLTTSALEALIERLYVEGGIYKHVSVNVTMTSKVFYVQGEINQPGQFQLTSGTTLLQAIAGARGPTAFANLKKVTIARHGKVYTYDIRKLEKDPSLDIKIHAGDVIKVWQKWY